MNTQALTGVGPVREEPDAVARLAGAVLGAWRRRSGLSREDFGRRSGYSAELVSSVEIGRRAPTTSYLTAADDICDAQGAITAMDPHIRQRPRTRPETDHRHGPGTALSFFAPTVLPDLFLTDSEAEARDKAEPLAVADEDGGGDGAAGRRRILDAGSPICLVLDEGVLLRTLGDRSAHHRHLADLADHPRITVQVLPLDSGEPPALTCPVTLLRHGDRASGFVHVDTGVHWLRPDAVRDVEQRFATLRPTALPPRTSRALVLDAADRTGR
ncbi:Scr1 family TA system antitoxin-like transcriptional regulator [Streptantibioticus silvisoli]|uniref:Scr1 family TA system antitoxin-like transcriptional regulator n=1 Tax=Streptantibioticus silvisoli TaxID=2705255 RepID=A0ABT6VTT2_9ACTN|nr:Scr1 family TA system antitoxin-like transcriptional regulator [Streptantibioticus silvisoli]MDI5961889.1 Scr1 family TA system antitoxin-like transcriptional regulator [Streptantibioticus silvisoli]